MKKILLSVSVIAAVAAVVFGITTAFFSDTEQSTGNTFTAGSLDLKVDNTCTYNDAACPEPTGIETTWTETDLGLTHKFFYFTDVKPGDDGEDTISLHVVDNDACGFVTLTKPTDSDVSCTEPELAEEPGCTPTGDGELDENVQFSIWADVCDGRTPEGLQYPNALPGDNIYQLDCDTPLTQGTLNGTKNWGLGDLAKSQTYYFGISWTLPSGVTNIVQSDSFTGDITFRADQKRNQYPTCPTGEITP